MESWSFKIDNDKLISLVLKGQKTATTYPYDEEDIPVIGKRTIVKFDNEKDACVVETKKFKVANFKDITPEEAYLEGEDDRTLESWRKVHMDYFTSFDKTFNENSLVIFEIFEMVENLVNKRLLLGRKIAEYNEDIIGKVESISEINAGFNNTLYYYWYKMSEQEKEKTINNLIEILKQFHHQTKSLCDWPKMIKAEVCYKINKCKDLFSKAEYNDIIKSLEKYDEYLSDNHFALIHNDLHFDNIIYDNGILKIIDFNDSMVAPIDYEFRQLYMCMSKPWKWANIEMDPLQKPNDYKNVFKYIKKYYNELNNIKYLEERMIIYSILNDVRHLKKYKSKELITSIIDNTKKING